MKKIILLTLTILLMMGCRNDYKNQDDSYNTSRSLDFKTIVIDSCEYIEGFYKLSHKGNCKYCKERRQKELENAVEQFKETISYGRAREDLLN